LETFHNDPFFGGSGSVLVNHTAANTSITRILNYSLRCTGRAPPFSVDRGDKERHQRGWMLQAKSEGSQGSSCLRAVGEHCHQSFGSEKCPCRESSTELLKRPSFCWTRSKG